MKRRTQLMLALLAVGYYVGCAPVQFSKDTNCGSNCVTINGKKTYRYSIIPNSGKVDILFVDDNSKSMSPEQSAMAARFSTFLSSLDSRSIDYRIAITTTDVNQAAGQLLPFSNGKSYLTPGNSANTQMFQNVIQRSETIACDSGQSVCPSNDERGIYAANLVIRNNPAGFIRSDAHLAIVFLSDEDERSQVYDQSASFRLSSDDLPQTLIANVQNIYGGKSVSAHAIIIRPGSLNGLTPEQAADRIANVIDVNGIINSSNAPANLFNGGDSSCLNAQTNQNGSGSTGKYGYLYALAVRMTGGVEGDICANDYGSQLYSIGENIGDQIAEHKLYCANPEQIDSTTPLVTFTPTGGAYSILADKMTFSPNLTPGTQAYLQYACPE
jgi:hypothetical protein